MKVSVIIPSYNTAHYVCEAIDSVLNSNLVEPFEIIVVDDGSKDNTKDVIIKYLSNPNFVYIQQENKGLSGARNTGIAKAKGEYLVFLDSDDIVLPTKLKKQLDFLNTHSEIDVVYSLSECFIENNYADRIKVNFPIYNGSILPQLLNGNFIHVNSVMARRNVVSLVGLFNQNYRELEDWDLWLRMSINGSKFFCLPEILSLVRVRKDSMTANQGKMNLAQVNVLLNLKQELKKVPSWKLLQHTYYKSLLQFALKANYVNFYTILKEAILIVGIKIVPYCIKLILKKTALKKLVTSNETTASLNKVWKNE